MLGWTIKLLKELNISMNVFCNMLLKVLTMMKTVQMMVTGVIS